MLTSYTDWLIKRFKDNRKTNKPLKKYMKDILLTNIKVEIEHNLDFDVDVTVKNQNVVHQISGYLIYRFLKDVKHCQECHKTMEVKEEDISPEFNAHHLTKTKSQVKFLFPEPLSNAEASRVLHCRFLRSRGYRPT